MNITYDKETETLILTDINDQVKQIQKEVDIIGDQVDYILKVIDDGKFRVES